MRIRHCIIVKFKKDIKKPSREEIRELFAHTLEIAGVYAVNDYANCIFRDNRYDLLIEMEMEDTALPEYDDSVWHKEWKAKYGQYIEEKTIIDLENSPVTTKGSYVAAEGRYDTALKYNYCGTSGLKMPEVSLGMWHNFGSIDNFENMKKVIFTAFDNGITHFDLANNYGPVYGSAEENFGKILKSDLGVYRDELLISTKAGYDMWPGPYGDHGSRKYLLSSLDQSLKRMGLDYVDIFYHHRPDPNTPLEETMGALASAVHSGKALYAGLSRYDGELMTKAMKILDDLNCPFVINQVRYSIFDRTIENDGLLETARKEGKGIITFSPLAQGILTDKYLNGIPGDSRIGRHARSVNENMVSEARLSQIRALNEVAKERGQSLAQMALSWVLKDDAITSVLIGASKPEQVLDNLKIAGRPKFTDEELKKIDEIWKIDPSYFG